MKEGDLVTLRNKKIHKDWWDNVGQINRFKIGDQFKIDRIGEYKGKSAVVIYNIYSGFLPIEYFYENYENYEIY